eukprot:TRINITY_DN73158_c0_g1_i1.p1 TRINITY_DN73158_c0_g1~~TRINITY_DN73158_c0_g1_i1.p1  ORF type:complete len:434 (-),score=78.88 TRINITY_DN73158_c0_g1_i1:117-1418(-)
MPGVQVLHKIEEDHLFALLCDLIVFSNLVYIGIEVDLGSDPSFAGIFRYCRFAFIGWCSLEFVIRIGGAGADFFKRPRNIAEICFVLCAVIDVALFSKPGWLWRMSGLRSWRMLRIYQYARTSDRLKELSLVLDALLRSSKAQLYLALVFTVTFYASGTWARGILTTSGSLDPENVPTGLNADEYFGNSLKAAFTMFQMATSDGWAEKVVRPILDRDLFGAVMMTLYTWCTSYTLVSLGIGVMVWATVEEARNGGDHATHMQKIEDRGLLKEVRKHFEDSLALQERDFIDFQEVSDAFSSPDIVNVFKTLELPITDALALWTQLGAKTEDFRTSLDDLMTSIEALTSKATAFDTCCLTARIGGTATFTTRLVARADDVVHEFKDIRQLLKAGIDELSRAAVEDEDLKEVPEVLLRKAGKINHQRNFKSQRFSG